MAFTKAQRTKVPLKIAFTGPAGAGKTMSALLLAMGMASADDKVFFIDTENDRAKLYDRLGGFMHCGISAPYSPQKYVSNFEEAIEAGAEVIVIDSMSHVWEADGGILSTKELMDARQGANSFTNWGAAKKPLAKLMVLILDSKVNVIVCIRSKQEYVQEYDEKKKKTVVVKKGMAPIMQPGVEYEFVSLLELDHTHIPFVPKDMTETLYDINEPIGRKHGKMLRKWQEGGADAPEPQRELASQKVIDKISEMAEVMDRVWLVPEPFYKDDARILYELWKPLYDKAMAVKTGDNDAAEEVEGQQQHDEQEQEEEEETPSEDTRAGLHDAQGEEKGPDPEIIRMQDVLYATSARLKKGWACPPNATKADLKKVWIEWKPEVEALDRKEKEAQQEQEEMEAATIETEPETTPKKKPTTNPVKK